MMWIPWRAIRRGGRAAGSRPWGRAGRSRPRPCCPPPRRPRASPPASSAALPSMPGPAKKRSGSRQKRALPVRIKTTSPGRISTPCRRQQDSRSARRHDMAGVERADAPLGGGIEEHPGRQHRRRLLDGVRGEPLPVADLRGRDAAVKHLGVRLMADGVDVRAAVLHADDHPGGAAAHAQLIGAVVVAVAAVEKVGIARLVGRRWTGIP